MSGTKWDPDMALKHPNSTLARRCSPAAVPRHTHGVKRACNTVAAHLLVEGVQWSISKFCSKARRARRGSEPTRRGQEQVDVV